MTFYEKLKEVGIQVEQGFGDYEEVMVPPFLIYYFDEPSTFKSDDKIYFKEDHYVVEHYFKDKDLEIEEKIEKALEDMEIIYSKSGDIWIDEEELYVNYYYC